MKALLAALGLLTACASAPIGARSDEPLEFSLRRLDGAPWRLSNERGHPVLLHFFATWCESCKVALPRDEALAQKFASRHLAAFAVSVDSDTQKVAAFTRDLKLSMPVLLDTDVRVADATLQMKGLPATFVFDAQGKLRYRIEGADNEKTSAALEAALAEVAP